MPTSLEPAAEPQTDSDEIDHEPLPDASALVDKTPEWFRSTRGGTLIVCILGVILCALYANRPLWHTDLWDHLNYGESMLANRQLPATEPLLPLAEGTPIVDTAWGSKVLTALLMKSPEGGLPALQFLHGLLVVLSLGLVGFTIKRLTESTPFAIVACFVFLAINWYEFLIFRPQTVGVLFFSLLACCQFSGCTKRNGAWWALPLLFVVWVNLHGSFVVGLLLLGLHAIGQFIDMVVATGSVSVAMKRGAGVRSFLQMQLCAAACLLNPWGLEVFLEVLRVGQHPNISSMLEWAPITLRSRQGQFLGGALVALFVCLQFSSRRLRAIEWVPLLVFVGLALWSGRMINWVAPLLGLLVGLHGAAGWRRFRRIRRPEYIVSGGLWTVVSLGLCWIAFGFTAFGAKTIHGREPEFHRMVSKETPLQVTEFLMETDLPRGITFAPAEWAGFLMQWEPKRLQPMVNLHVHVIPKEVWNDYMRLHSGASDWEGITDRYSVNLLVIDLDREPILARRVAADADWKRLFQDVQSAVYVRKAAKRSLPGRAPVEEPQR